MSTRDQSPKDAMPRPTTASDSAEPEPPSGLPPRGRRSSESEAGGTERSASSASARPPSHWRSFLSIAVVVVALDQISKRYVDAHLPLYDSWPNDTWPFRFEHVKNTGAAFSVLQNQTVFLTVMSVLGLAAIVFYFVFRPSDHPLLRLALALQLGGAIGNLIDRARYGHVTDFIRIPHWPVFNVADSAISVGVTAVVILLLFAGDTPSDGPARAT